MTSKSDLQSLRNELATLKIRLRDLLEQQRVAFTSLRDVLNNIEVPALFLDNHLHLRFLTRMAQSLFEVDPYDIGRSLSHIAPLGVDLTLPDDARETLETRKSIEREIKTPAGALYQRRTAIMRAEDDAVEGVVVTYADVTAQRQLTASLETARQQAQLSNSAKSRLLASASHDLRQPLQSLVLLHSLLTKTVEGQKAQELVARFDETLNSMSAMLNSLLDLNQIEAGTIRPEKIRFSIKDLLEDLQREFTPQAMERGLFLRVLPCRAMIESDPRLLEQALRNLLSNAFKYTPQGKVLVGCRRRKERLDIQVWDTGIGIPSVELDAIFEEFHQLSAAKRERSEGLGLGLSIVQRLARLLGHKVKVGSQLGKGSVFTIEVARSTLPEWTTNTIEQEQPDRRLPMTPQLIERENSRLPVQKMSVSPETAIVFVVDDDRYVREALRRVLEDDGRFVEDFETCQDFLNAFRPGREACLLIDAYLPGMNGLELLRRLQELGERPPAIMITGAADVSTAVQAMKAGALDFIEKPIGRTELLLSVQQALEQARDSSMLNARREAAASQICDLTPRQRQIMEMVLAGHPSKNIAADLRISQRTVENHRASIMKKTGSKSLPELARLALMAASKGPDMTSPN